MLQPSYGEPQLGRNKPLSPWILGETNVLGQGLGNQAEKGPLRVFRYFNTSIDRYTDTYQLNFRLVSTVLSGHLCSFTSLWRGCLLKN